MTVAVNTEGRGCLCIDITGVASTADGGIGAVVNPEGVNLCITKTTFHFTTPADAAANLSVGVAAAATTAATDILNVLDVNAVAADSWYNGHARQNTAKTDISAPADWAAGYYITFTGSATTVGLVGKLYVEYYRI
jgi:hypothetical protein